MHSPERSSAQSYFWPVVLAVGLHVLLFAMLAGQTALTDPLALGLLAARVLQSLVHLLSTAPLFVWLRFASYLMQVLILAWWLLQLSGLL